MKKKFLPALNRNRRFLVQGLLILLLSLTSSLALFSNIAIAEEEGFTAKEETLGADVPKYQTHKKSAENNYDIHKAYADFDSNRSVETAKKLQEVLSKTDIGKDLTIYNPNNGLPILEIVLNKINDQIKNNSSFTQLEYDPDKEKKNLEDIEKKVDQTTIIYEVALGDLSSQKKIYEFEQAVENAKDIDKEEAESRLAIAETVRRFQDLDRIKKLGCLDKKKIENLDIKNTCILFIKEYSDRCGKIEKCELNASKLPLDPKKYAATKASATQAIRKIEQEMQDALKKELMDERLEVSKILRYRTKETQSKTLENINEADFIQEDYTKHGIVYFISRIVDSLVLATGSLAVVALIIGGYLLMFSGADEQKREAGKEVIKYTVIGMIFIFSSYAIVSLIMGIFYNV